MKCALCGAPLPAHGGNLRGLVAAQGIAERGEEAALQTHVLNLADASATSKALLPEAPHSPRPQPPFSQLLAGVPDAAQARIKRLQDAATSMQSDVAALSTAKSSEEALRLISGIVKAYDGELYR